VIGVALLLLAGWGVLVVVGTAMLVRGLRYPPRKTAGVAVAHGEATELEEAGLSGEAIELRLSDGRASPGWWIEGRRADGPVVVICHGYGDSRYGAMAAWAPRVLGWAGGVVVYDNRGQGDSGSPAADGSLGESRDLRAVVGQVSAMREGVAARGVVLYGYSMGANAAIRAAAMEADGRERVRRGRTVRTGEAGEAVASDEGGEHARVWGVIADSPYCRWDGPVRRLFRDRRWPCWPVVPLAGGWLGIPRRWEDVDRVAERLPSGLALLAFSTEGDRLVDPADAAAIVSSAEGAGVDAELVAFDHGTHLMGYDVDEAAYTAALGRLFAKVERARG
jgi:pimeloyl-ACP methyl ester carboxylesterase